MGIFGRKKETTHFERDTEGRVVQVTRNGQEVDPQELRMKTSEQLEREYYNKHPEKRHPTMRKIGSGLAKVDKKIVKYNQTRNIMYRKQPIQRGGYSPRGNANPFGSMFDTGMPHLPRSQKKKSKVKYKVIGGKAYPIAGTGSKKKSKKKSTRRKTGFDDPFAGLGW